MRLIKMIGFTVAAAASMAFMGASLALAEGSTALCKVNQDPCAEANLVKEVHMVAGTTVLKTNLATVLCLSSLAVAEVEAAGLSLSGQPLGLTVSELTWENCGTNAAHNNCTVENINLPLVDALKFAFNLGPATVLGAEVLVICAGILSCIFGGPKISGFSLEGALHSVGTGHGMFTASELTIPKVKGIVCPATAKWTALYEPLEHIYIVS